MSHREGRQVNHPGGVPMPSVAQSRSPTTPCVPSAPRAPAASLAVVDFWAKLDRRRSGEDDHITIEHHRERCHDLNGDFGAADTTPMMQAARTPTSPGSGGGCMPLAPHLRMVV
jgi:hypothetical protein